MYTKQEEFHHLCIKLSFLKKRYSDKKLRMRELVKDIQLLSKYNKDTSREIVAVELKLKELMLEKKSEA